MMQWIPPKPLSFSNNKRGQKQVYTDAFKMYEKRGVFLDYRLAAVRYGLPLMDSMEIINYAVANYRKQAYPNRTKITPFSFVQINRVFPFMVYTPEYWPLFVFEDYDDIFRFLELFGGTTQQVSQFLPYAYWSLRPLFDDEFGEKAEVFVSDMINKGRMWLRVPESIELLQLLKKKVWYERRNKRKKKRVNR
jgi:hypothetical protein